MGQQFKLAEINEGRMQGKEVVISWQSFSSIIIIWKARLSNSLSSRPIRERAEDKMSLNSPSLAKSSTVSIAVTHQQPQIHPELSLVALNWLRWKNLTTHYMLETTYISSVLDTGKYTTADAAPMSVTRWRSCRGMAYCSRAQRALPAPRDPQILKLALMLPISNTGMSYSEWPESCKHQKLQDLLTTANWDILTPTQWAV